MTQTPEQLEAQNGRFAAAMLQQPPAEHLQQTLDDANRIIIRLRDMVTARDAKLARLEAELDKAGRKIADLEIRLFTPGETLSEIIQWTARKHKIKVSELTGPRRFRDFVRARQEYFWLAKRHTTKSYPQIGRACGDRDHSTVIYGEERHQDRIDAGEVTA